MQSLIRPTLLALTLAGAAAAQDPAVSPATVPVQDPAQETSEFGEALIVNGARIPDLEIKRFLVYGPGRNALEARKLEILMKQERELREYKLREGLAQERHGKSYEELTGEQVAAIDQVVAEELAHLDVPREAAKERIAEYNADFRERYPTLDPETETERAYKSIEWYEDQVYQTMRFDEMFFPGHPDDWPAISIEAIHAGSPEFDLVADYAKHWERRKREAEEAGQPMEREEDMMMGILRDYVMAALYSLVETRSSVDGLPPELLMTIEGMGLYDEIRTEEIYAEFADAFTWRDIAETKRFLALQTAARQELEEQGALKDREEFLEGVRDMRERLETNMFNWQFIALMGHQFPSEEAYTEHLYLLESYKALIEDEITREEDGQLSPELQGYMDYANTVMGIGRCLTEVCFVSAFDFPNNEWKPGGFEAAHERALALRAEIDAHIDRLNEAEEAKQAAVAAGENYEWPEDLLGFDQWWANFLDLHSEFWDPPLPISGKAPPDIGRKNKGRFQGDPMTRNDYKRSLGESSYYYYLFDTSAADQVFMDLEPGSVGGPYVGPYGYYIVYLRRQQPPSNPLSPAQDRHFQMVVDSYSRDTFTDFAHEALEKAETSGVPDGLGG